jgi:hypothetical protein
VGSRAGQTLAAALVGMGTLHEQQHAWQVGQLSAGCGIKI